MYSFRSVGPKRSEKTWWFSLDRGSPTMRSCTVSKLGPLSTLTRQLSGGASYRGGSLLTMYNRGSFGEAHGSNARPASIRVLSVSICSIATTSLLSSNVSARRMPLYWVT